MIEHVPVQREVRGDRLQGRADDVHDPGVGKGLQQRLDAHGGIVHLRHDLRLARGVNLPLEAALEEGHRGAAHGGRLVVGVNQFGEIGVAEGQRRQAANELRIAVVIEEHFLFLDVAQAGGVAGALGKHHSAAAGGYAPTSRRTSFRAASDGSRISHSSNTQNS